jgi:hypothetical protein
LSSLTASGATEQEEDVRLWEHSETFVFLNGEGYTCEVLQPIVKFYLELIWRRYK